ncbi:MAG: helicase-related protein, partial [Dokdonella sp.]
GKLDEHRSIVFINTKAMAERVMRALERQGHRVATLSGDVPQAKRERLLARFQKGDIELLVATDVAARGLHIPAVSHVFNFDLPQDAEDYVHRIGRTARLGAEGDAISFACDRYAQGLPDIEAYIEQKIPTASVNADMLIVPPAKVRADGVVFVDDEAEAADDARNTAGAPPKAAPPRRSGGPTGAGRSGGPRDARRGAPSRGESRPPRSSTPKPAAAPTIEPGVASIVASGQAAAKSLASRSSSAAAPAADVPAGESDPATKRRRRGGRGRGRREGGETASATTASNGNGAGRPEPTPGERKPRRERAPPIETNVPSTSEPVAPTAHKKSGFLHRIARFFGAR